MTTAEAALRQLLADVEAASISPGWSHGPLSACPPHFLRYIEKLARDGLAGPLAGWTEAPEDWVCTHESACDRHAIYSDGKEEGACEEHAVAMGAVAMGAKAGT